MTKAKKPATKSRLRPSRTKTVGIVPAAEGHKRPHVAAKRAKTAQARPRAAKPAPEPKRGSREAQVVALLRRPEGLSVEELMEACGVQSHTARAMISVFGRKAGSVNREGKRYRIA